MALLKDLLEGPEQEEHKMLVKRCAAHILEMVDDDGWEEKDERQHYAESYAEDFCEDIKEYLAEAFK